MSSITYTAVRGIISGHSSGTDYSLDFDAQRLDSSHKEFLDESRALDGTTEALLHRIEAHWRITSHVLTESERSSWLEFLKSTAAREAFTFDPYGTSASPDNPFIVRRRGEWVESRQAGARLYTFTFTVVEV